MGNGLRKLGKGSNDRWVKVGLSGLWSEFTHRLLVNSSKGVRVKVWVMV